MVFVKSAYKAFALSSTITSITLIFAGAFLKAYATYKIATDWISYVTYASIFRYASAALNYNQIESIGSLNCSLTEATDFQRVPLADFCRWENGSSYLREIYSESTIFPDYWSNFAACFVAVGALGLITIVLYALPLPHVVERKFRYK
uniref:Uncharacterized protein n=1 Tax=Plectus sambesii TaxID=2011161 RepID=A0A914W8F8_9BILA